MFLRAQLKRTYALQRFSTTLTKQSVSNIWIELRKESLNIPKIMETMQQQPTVKLDHTLSKKLITTILSTNSRHYLEILWSNVNQYQMYKSPLYAFLFDQIVKARMSGDLNFVRKMLEIALNSPESEISEFYKQWHEMEQNSPLYIDWIRIMPLTESIFILEDTWNLILTGYVQTKRFLAWKIYDYLVKSNRLRIRTSAYFLQTVKHQRKEFNKVFSDLLNIERHTWDQFSCQSLMETTCQVYRFKKALELLEIFKSIGKDDLSVYVMLLMKLVKREFFIDANLVLDQLKEKNFEWSKEAWFVVANYYASAGFEEKYHETIQYILDTYGSSPETFGLELNAIYKSNEQNELKAEQLLAKFDEMVSSGTLSNPVIMNLLVQAFGELGYQSHIDSVIEYHQKHGIYVGMTTIEILLKSRIKSGNNHIEDVIQLMLNHQLKPRYLTHSLILESLTMHPTPKMMEYYYEMRNKQIRPTFDVMMKMLIALEEIQDWDSFVIVARHVIVNPHFNLYEAHDLDFIAKCYMLAKKVSHMKLYWEAKLQHWTGLWPSTFGHVVHCFLGTEMQDVIPLVWEKAKAEDKICHELSIGMMEYWSTHHKWTEIQHHFKEIEGIVSHDICSLILKSPYLELDFRWDVYLYLKANHIPSQQDFENAFDQKEPSRLEILLMDYQHHGHSLNEKVMQSLQPLFAHNPQVKDLVEMQYAFEHCN